MSMNVGGGWPGIGNKEWRDRFLKKESSEDKKKILMKINIKLIYYFCIEKYRSLGNMIPLILKVVGSIPATSRRKSCRRVLPSGFGIRGADVIP